MRLGVALWADRDVASLARLAACAEQVGFDDVWWPDHYMHRDVGATLTACALATDRARLGTAVTSPLLRHPGALASLFASLAEIAPGRIVAGLGPGGWELPAQLAIHEPRPLTATRHAVEVLAPLLRGERTTAAPGPSAAPSANESAAAQLPSANEPAAAQSPSANEPAAAPQPEHRFPVTDAGLDFVPPQPIPLYLAARGPRMMALAGELADGVITHSLSLPFIERVVEQVELGAARRAVAASPSAAPVSAVAASPSAPPVSAVAASPSAAPVSAVAASPSAAPVSAVAASPSAAPVSAVAASPSAAPVSAVAASPPVSAVAASPSAAPVSAVAPASQAPDSSGCEIAVWVEIFLHDDLAHAFDVLRRRCLYMVGGEFSPEMIPLYGLDPEEVMPVRRAVRRRDPEAPALITNQMVDAFSVCGSVARAAERIDALRRAGVGQLILSLGHGIEESEIASVGQTVRRFLDSS